MSAHVAEACHVAEAVRIPSSNPRSLSHPATSPTPRRRSDDRLDVKLARARLDVTAHDIIPGFTAPGIGAVNYGLWELRAGLPRG